MANESRVLMANIRHESTWLINAENQGDKRIRVSSGKMWSFAYSSSQCVLCKWSKRISHTRPSVQMQHTRPHPLDCICNSNSPFSPAQAMLNRAMRCWWSIRKPIDAIRWTHQRSITFEFNSFALFLTFDSFTFRWTRIEYPVRMPTM